MSVRRRIRKPYKKVPGTVWGPRTISDQCDDGGTVRDFMTFSENRNLIIT